MIIEVFECKSGVSKKGNAYHVVLARVDNKVGKLFSDVVVPEGRVDADIEMATSFDLTFSPRITGFKAVD